MSAKARRMRAKHASTFQDDVRSHAVESLVSGFHIFYPSPARRREIVQFLINDEMEIIHDAHDILGIPDIPGGQQSDGEQQPNVIVGSSTLGPCRSKLRNRLLEHVAHSEEVLSSLLPIDLPTVSWKKHTKTKKHEQKNK